MKLKTLNDLYDESSDGNINYNKLKQEAIKWVKKRIKKCLFSCRNNYRRCEEHIFWMDKFNITEDDLK